MLSTENSLTMEENINCVFGNKFFSTLVPIDVVMPIQSSVEGEEVSEAGSLSADPAEGCSPTQVTETGKQTSFLLVGFMSKVGEGVGRSDNDRQFVFCNGRPVDMPKIVKVFNEVQCLLTIPADYVVANIIFVECFIVLASLRDEQQSCFYSKHCGSSWFIRC